MMASSRLLAEICACFRTHGLGQVVLIGDPATVRMKQRIATNNFRINGVDLAPAAKTIEWDKKIID